MNLHKLKIRSIFFLPLIVSLLAMVAVTGCSDEEDALQTGQYGYVQFKLYKSTGEGAATRATDKLELLSDAKKINVVMLRDGVTLSQTLVLNSYNAENAEFGLRSDKLQLLTGTYKIVGYYLYDKLDEELLAGSVEEDDEFTVVQDDLQEKALTVNTVTRGMVKFKLIKDGLSTRAPGEYLFSQIKLADITVTNLFTKKPTTIKGFKVTYKEESKEHQNPDNDNDKYMDIATAKCDSAVWLPAGNYQVTSYTTYSKNGNLVKTLETQAVKGEQFTVKDNALTDDAIVPIKLSRTAEYIKDYLALKEIWDALNGKNWSQQGFGTQPGANWNFNKELDMWGAQPGVSLNSNGRVTGLSLEGFGASGRVPDAIGQLTELEVLALGSHGEKVNERLFGPKGISANMSDEQKQKMRMHYQKTFVDYDPREDFSDLIKDCINSDPQQKSIKKSSRITLKDTQIGQLSNNITFVSKAVMRLTKLRQFYMGNSPFVAENICEAWENENSEYAQQYKTEDLKWDNLKDLTDVEVYNCPNLTKLPTFLKALPEMQLINVACNRGISGEQLKDDWQALADAPVGEKIQIIYIGYNNLKTFPVETSLQKMKKLGMLECLYNQLEGKLPAFGSEIKLASLNLAYNQITEIPANFCGFTEQVENLSFAHNKLKYIPNIFDAKSVSVMSAIDFSYNEIGSVDGKNFDPLDATPFKGINVSSINLSNNQISKFPKELFSTGSPLSSINLMGNMLTEIPKNSLKDEDENFKNTYLLTSIDLRFNKLTKLSDDFRATTLPYLVGIDLSYNSFSKFPTQPLNSSTLKGFGIRNQRDAQGNRTLREWPEGITLCPSLTQLQIGSNDIRKVNEKITPNISVLDIKDNPNISIDLSYVCPYIEAGMYMLFYDKTQDIRGCDALDIKR